MIFIKKFPDSSFNEVLKRFQIEIDAKNYNEKIEYTTWRKLKNAKDVEVKIYDASVVVEYASGVGETFDISDNGFGAFFCNEYFNKECPMTSLNDVSYGAASSAIATKVDSNITSLSSDSTSNTHYYGGTGDFPVHGTISSSTTTINICSEIEERLDKVEKYIENNEKNIKKEEKNMTGFNFDFGPCNANVRLSMYGMAIKNIADEWVSYNPKTKEIVNVDVFNLPDGGKYIYKMPVAIKDVAVGDIVVHNRVPMFVIAIGENGTFDVVDPRAGENKTIIPTRNMFNFSFMTKIVNFFDGISQAPTAEAPFGNMLPFLMMSEGGFENMDPMLFFMMTQNKDGDLSSTFSNPMMMYFMMKDSANMKDNLMPMLMMSQMAKK